MAEKTPREIVDGSGYLLQIAVAHRVQHMTPNPGWAVVVTEHPWRFGDTSKFIDVVLSCGAIRLVLECKRPGGGEYTFLVPHDARPANRARCGWMVYEYDPDTAHLPPKVDRGWHDFGSTSLTYETAYAILPGKEQGRTPILERLASEAVEACDALAVEELGLAQQNRRRLQRLYVPTIVTTAPLRVVRYQSEAIDVSTATLTGDIETHEVGSLWFRKSLTTKLSENAAPEDLAAANADRERSVLVISAAYLESSLGELNITGAPPRSR